MCRAEFRYGRLHSIMTNKKVGYCVEVPTQEQVGRPPQYKNKNKDLAITTEAISSYKSGKQNVIEKQCLQQVVAAHSTDIPR
jgi:hypothetical protein